MRHYLALKLDPIPLLGAVTMWTKKRAWNFQNMDISSAKMSDGFFLMLLVARLLLQIGTIRQFYKDNFDNKNSNLQFIFYTYVKPEVSLSSKSQENHGYSKTLTEYKSEKLQEEKAKRTRVIIDKDGNKFLSVLPPLECIFVPPIKTDSKFSQIGGRFTNFKRCDYDSFSKRISNCWLFNDHFKLSIAMRMYLKQLLPIFTSQSI